MGYFAAMKTTKLMLHATTEMYLTETMMYKVFQGRKVLGYIMISFM